MPRPFLSFLTDFGPDGPAPVCRGVMLTIAPDAQIVDIGHNVRKYAIRDGAFLLWSAVPFLPVGVHVAVVDPGVGTDRRPIAIKTHRGDVLVGPDNGLLMPPAERLGGIAEATPAAVRVLDAMGLDIVIVETVGVGQSEVAIAGAADCTTLVTMPGGGDSIQAMKAGIMEIGDVFVVNKADRDGAARTKREITVMLRLDERKPAPPVLLTRADIGEGVEAVVDAIDAHLTRLDASGVLADTRLRHFRREALELIGHQARRRTIAALDDEAIAEFDDALRERRLDPATVATQALARIAHA